MPGLIILAVDPMEAQSQLEVLGLVPQAFGPLNRWSQLELPLRLITLAVVPMVALA